MDFEIILPIALKVLGCAVGIYFIAGFLVSLTKLLPFLAILSSVGTIISINLVREAADQSLLWIPLALTLLTQLFYQGEGYMNPKIHENVYSLVNVERKYTSIFAEFDTYELHFRPFETGGFIENTLIFGILFGLYYNFLLFPNPDTWYVYILPIYLLIMSVVDALGVIGILRPAPFFYGALRILVCIISVAIGCLGGPSSLTNGPNNSSLYEQTEKFDVFNLEDSYYAYYEHNYYDKAGKKHQQKEVAFLYDANREVGAEYEDYSSGRVFTALYLADTAKGTAMKLENSASHESPSWLYVQTAIDNGTAMKYFNLEISRYMELCALTEEKVLNTKFFHKGDGTYQIDYNTEYDGTYDKENLPRYRVCYTFGTDPTGKLNEFLGLEFEIFVDDNNVHTLSYSIAKNDTGLGKLFKGNTLQNAVYGEKLVFGIDFTSAMDPFNGTTGSINDYDFRLDENNDSIYAYDKESGTIAVFKGEDRYDRLFKAEGTGGFEAYPPDFYISAATRRLYDAELNLIDDEYENADASRIINNILKVDFDGDVRANIRGENAGSVTLTRTLSGFEGEIYYNFDVEKRSDEYTVSCLRVTLNLNEKEYTLVIYLDADSYDIPVELN